MELQAKSFRPTESDDETDDDFSDDEELQSPIDDVDPFVFFVDIIKGKMLAPFVTSYPHSFSYHRAIFSPTRLVSRLALQASDPLRFQNLTQTLDFRYQALANGVAQHAELRRVEIEKQKLEKAASVAS